MYATAFNGEKIKKCCETCSFYADVAGEYQPVFYACNWNDENNNFHQLLNFPFKNGCKHFELHHTYSVDWCQVAKEFEAKNCQHERSGYCFESFNTTCESAIDCGPGVKACEKAI